MGILARPMGGEFITGKKNLWYCYIMIWEFVGACYHSEVFRLPILCNKKVRAAFWTSHCMDSWDHFFQEHISFSGKMNYVAGMCPSVYNHSLQKFSSIPSPAPPHCCLSLVSFGLCAHPVLFAFWSFLAVTFTTIDCMPTTLCFLSHLLSKCAF
ncbi:hypothetical protein SCLCIDRAFT_490266 [Scleroderma citrinum Foug A]|uniref:Uncharacterized protein n=1 Tax=Scleroderma citrinum Foug A TaxID=1036808 RepID=A0A0C3EAY4_9AGAM|nr:hypothetical protein SCLCIDRAFT_490266 [Scleroderma citrinum Foug A]